VILVDSNIPMYLVGADAPYKEQARRLVVAAVNRRERLVTDAEVLQEILHRYTAIRRLDAIQPAFDALLSLVDEVLPVDVAVIEEAKRIVLGSYGLSARDAVHLGVMAAAGISSIMTFDAAFDGYPGVERMV
jgi:predicted nucleic acid-binding protein